MIFKGISRIVVLFLILSTVFFKPSFGATKSCIPKDHSSYDSIQVAHIFDNIVGLVSDILFGKRKGASLNIFDKYETDFGDRNWKNGLTYKMFISTVTDGRFQVIIYLAVVLYIAYMGVGFAMGFSEITASSLISQCLKIGIIIMFTTESGWETYLEYVVKNVIESSRQLNRMIIANMYNVPVSQVTSPFEPLDMLMSFIINGNTWTKIFGMLWGKGIIFLMLILIVLLFTIATIFIITAKVAVIYLVALTLAAVLLSLGPFFMVFLLFSYTKGYFDKWLSNLIGLFLQQYMLFLGFFIFCVILVGMLKGLFYFEVCFTPVINLTLKVKMPQFIQSIIDVLFGIIRVLSFGLVKVSVDLPEFVVYLVQPLIYSHSPTDSTFSLLIDIFSISSLLVAGMMFSQFTDTIADLGNDIAGGSVSSSGIATSSSIYGGLNKLQGKVSDAAGSALKSVATGGPVFAAMRAASRLASFAKKHVDKAIEQNAKFPDGSFNKTVGVKLLTALSIGLKGVEHAGNLVQSESRVNTLRAIESNNAQVERDLKKGVKALGESKKQAKKEEIMKAKGYTSEKQLKAADYAEMDKAKENISTDEKQVILDKAMERVMKDGHSGKFKKEKTADGKTIVKELSIQEAGNEKEIKELMTNYTIRKAGFALSAPVTAQNPKPSEAASNAGHAVENKLRNVAAKMDAGRGKKFVQAFAGIAGTTTKGVVKGAQVAGDVASTAGAGLQRTRFGPITKIQNKFGDEKNKKGW